MVVEELIGESCGSRHDYQAAILETVVIEVENTLDASQTCALSG
jgi:hypothetical protein